MAAVGVVVFVTTAIVVFVTVGEGPNHEVRAPGWSVPLAIVACALIITGSVMASGESDGA
jgi:hypothetical protein